MVLWFLFFVIFAHKPAADTQYTYNDQFVYSRAVSSVTGASAIENIIISKARNYQIDPDLFLRIAKCESGLWVDAQNPRSSASGIFQFLNSTFFTYAKAYELPTNDKNDPEVQAELAARMIANGGLGHWAASKFCWQ